MHVFRCASREGGYLNSRISRHFMALKMLENRIPGNHNCLLTIRSRLIALCCRLGWHRLISSLCCNIDRPARGSSETSDIVICSTVILITHIHFSSVIRRRGSKLFRVSVISGRTAFWLRSRFPFFPRFSSIWTQQSLDFGSLFSASLFSCIMMVNASIRDSFPCSNDKTWLSKVKHSSSKSLIALSFLETEDNNVSHLFL